MGIFRKRKKAVDITCDDPFCGCHDVKVYRIPLDNVYSNAAPLTDMEKSEASMSNAEDICAAPEGNADARANTLGWVARIGEITDAIQDTLGEMVASMDLDSPIFSEPIKPEFPDSPEHVFEALANDDRHTVLQNPYRPVCIEGDEDRSIHIARVLLDGMPYSVLCTVVDNPPNDPMVEIARSYIYLADDFAFNLYHEIIEKRYDRIPFEGVER